MYAQTNLKIGKEKIFMKKGVIQGGVLSPTLFLSFLSPTLVGNPCVNPCGNSYHQPLIFQLDVRWNMIACGKTKPTLEMTEQARNYLNTMKPRSLDL